MTLRTKPCAYCGTTAVDRTKGHVVPRSIYPSLLPNAQRLTVPECLDCKKHWENADPHFRNILITIWNPEKTVKDNRFNKMARSFTKRDGQRRFKELTGQFVTTANAGQVREIIYPARDEQFNLVLRRIVRGLCHHHGLGSAIADARVACDVMLWKIPDQFQSEITWHDVGPDFFRYGFSLINDNQLHSFWLIRFSKHIEFFGIVRSDDVGSNIPTNVV